MGICEICKDLGGGEVDLAQDCVQWRTLVLAVQVLPACNYVRNFLSFHTYLTFVRMSEGDMGGYY
jgi:hypothetical protein